MAEARVEDEEESLREAREAGGARRNPRAPTAASERADRNKPEQRQSSTQGALSSIRAVIKRTSNRTAAPTDQNRERRRPEITILAAEPLATNWFPGASGAFPPAPPPAQPSWTGSVTVQLPPPSYEQVIREKSREQNTQTVSVASSSSSSSSSPSSSLSSSSSSSAPRHTTTIATQTDPETSEPQSCTRPSMRRPPKPPRPSLPLTPKPAEPVLAHTHSLIELDEADSSCSTHTPTHPPSGERCGVQTDFTHALEPLTPISPDSSLSTQNSQSQPLVKQEISARPRPRPRSKALLQPANEKELQDQPISREVKVQTLVRFKDNGTNSIFAGFTDPSLDVASSKYLQDLLDVFGCDKQGDQRDESDQSEKSDEEESVNFESCLVSRVASEPSETITRPEPRPRTQNPKPPIAAKPCGPTVSAEEIEISSEDQNKPSVHPVPAHRPLVKKSSVSQQQGSSEEKTEACRLRPPPRPPLAARKSASPTQEDIAQPAEVPFNPFNPRSDDQDSATATSGKPVAITSSSRGQGKCPAKPPSQRRPPPPTHTPAHPPAQDAFSAVSISKSDPSLSHQASECRLLPLRPPPVKSSKSVSSSLTTATTNQRSGYRGVKRGPPLPPRPKPGHPLYREHTSKIPQGNTKVNPPSSNPEEYCPQKEKLLVVLDDTAGPTQTPGFPGDVKGQRQDSMTEEPVFQKSPELNNEPQKEEPQQPETNTSVRYRACFAFDGEDGELRLRDGDVITLIEHINDEWGRGSLNGRTGFFPLNFVQLVQESPTWNLTPEPPEPAVNVGEGQTGRALYDFIPESEDELCLKVGDVVSSLEEVDEEWFVGEFAGRRGIIPKNYIQVL